MRLWFGELLLLAGCGERHGGDELEIEMELAEMVMDDYGD
jgi:hypothetical protein